MTPVHGIAQVTSLNKLNPRMAGKSPKELREIHDVANELSEAMQPSDGKPGVYGNMLRNGLRSNDTWRTVVGEKNSPLIEERLKQLSQKYKVDLTDPAKRNEFINSVYCPWIDGKILDLPLEKLKSLRDIAKSLQALGALAASHRIRGQNSGDYSYSNIQGNFRSNFGMTGDYSDVSPLGKEISQGAIDNDTVTGYSKHYCLRGVRVTLENAGVANKRKVPWAIHAVNTFRENENFREVDGVNVGDVDKLPVGTVVIYNHPADAGRGVEGATRPGHIQVKVRVNGKDQWVSDFWQNNGHVYRGMSSEQKVWAFVPKDYFDK